MKKSGIIAGLFLVAAGGVRAQESASVYHFLQFPQAAHTTALGGVNISAVDDDAAAALNNPALLSTVSDKTLSLNFMTYAASSKQVGATFVKAFGERHTAALEAHYFGYGTMDETDNAGNVVGSFSAKDIAVSGALAYVFNDRLAGGVTAKFVTSAMGGYTAIGVGVDLGLNYYDEDRELSLSAVARNLGGQVKAYEDDFERMPFDLQVGITKRIGMSPLRLSATMTKLHDWNESFMNHFVVGLDVLLSSSIYVAAGYNFRRTDEMSIDDGEGSSSHGAGLSFGAGLQLERFKLQASYAKYHVSSTSLLFNVSYSL